MNRGTVVFIALIFQLTSLTFVTIAVVHVMRAHRATHASTACKVCHCGKVACHSACNEENMCTMRCEGLCKATSKK